MAGSQAAHGQSSIASTLVAAEHMRPVGTVSSPTSDGRSEMLTALLQPASEPAPREGETTYGGPKGGARMARNLGIAYVP
jgi:hypothetical protein